MTHPLRRGLVGLALGLGTGVAVAVLLRPGRKSVAPSAGAGPLDALQGAIELAALLSDAMRAPGDVSGLLPDERITLRVRTELERRGVGSPRANITTIDGTVYVRGREPQPMRADLMLQAIREVPGVVQVVDELKRA